MIRGEGEGEGYIFQHPSGSCASVRWMVATPLIKKYEKHTNFLEAHLLLAGYHVADAVESKDINVVARLQFLLRVRRPDRTGGIKQ